MLLQVQKMRAKISKQVLISAKWRDNLEEKKILWLVILALPREQERFYVYPVDSF